MLGVVGGVALAAAGLDGVFVAVVEDAGTFAVDGGGADTGAGGTEDVGRKNGAGGANLITMGDFSMNSGIARPDGHAVRRGAAKQQRQRLASTRASWGRRGGLSSARLEPRGPGRGATVGRPKMGLPSRWRARVSGALPAIRVSRCVELRPCGYECSIERPEAPPTFRIAKQTTPDAEPISIKPNVGGTRSPSGGSIG